MQHCLAVVFEPFAFEFRADIESGMLASFRRFGSDKFGLGTTRAWRFSGFACHHRCSRVSTNPAATESPDSIRVFPIATSPFTTSFRCASKNLWLVRQNLGNPYRGQLVENPSPTSFISIQVSASINLATLPTYLRSRFSRFAPGPESFQPDHLDSLPMRFRRFVGCYLRLSERSFATRLGSVVLPFGHSDYELVDIKTTVRRYSWRLAITQTGYRGISRQY